MLWVAIGQTLVSVCCVILKYAALAVKFVHVSPVPGKRPHLIHFRCKTNDFRLWVLPMINSPTMLFRQITKLGMCRVPKNTS